MRRAHGDDAGAFLAGVERELSVVAHAPTIAAYAQAAPLTHHHPGLRRYLERTARASTNGSSA
jgi:hypothetical protein